MYYAILTKLSWFSYTHDIIYYLQINFFYKRWQLSVTDKEHGIENTQQWPNLS